MRDDDKILLRSGGEVSKGKEWGRAAREKQDKHYNTVQAVWGYLSSPPLPAAGVGA